VHLIFNFDVFLLFQVFLPGFLSSNLYYKYLNDLIHSVRGDEFLGGNVSLAAHGSVGLPEESHSGGSDSSTSQVLPDLNLPLGRKTYKWFPSNTSNRLHL
jgi:hypothetical protein